MSANLIHNIYNKHNTKYESKPIFFKINCAKATKKYKQAYLSKQR